MAGLTGQLYRLRDPVTGKYLHFTRLDLTTNDERQAWCGTEKMIEGVREARPETQKFQIIPHEKQRRVYQ